MSPPLFDTHLVVDWSARSDPSPSRPSPDAIWLCAAKVRAGAISVEEPVYLRTRSEAADYLAERLAEEIEAGRRVLAGFDFPFGYPAGVAEKVTGAPSALALWHQLAELIEDGADNANNRYAVAAQLNRLWPGTAPFWGRPDSVNEPDIPVTARERRGELPSNRRLADDLVKGAKTVWQLAYAGSVGSQMLLGIPMLERLRHDPRLRDHVAVWPFETGLTVPGRRSERAGRGGGRDVRPADRPVWLVELYPSLIREAVAAARRPQEILDAAQTRINATALARLDAAGSLAPLFAGAHDLNEAQRRTVEDEEAWILGLGHSALLDRAARDESVATRAAACSGTEGEVLRQPVPLRYQRDPQAIYRESFATVRAETRLDHLPTDLHGLAIRLVHACGMTDIANRLAWSTDLGSVGRAALAAGAPILCDCEMVASGVIRARLPRQNPVVVTLNDPRTSARAEAIGNTRSAAAVELWADRLAGAVVAIGNAPTALFHLLELLDAGAPRPAAILAFPVGFVGAAESKAELAARPRGVPFLTLRGRRGGSAMAAAAVNALAATPEA